MFDLLLAPLLIPVLFFLFIVLFVSALRLHVVLSGGVVVRDKRFFLLVSVIVSILATSVLYGVLTEIVAFQFWFSGNLASVSLQLILSSVLGFIASLIPLRPLAYAGAVVIVASLITTACLVAIILFQLVTS